MNLTQARSCRRPVTIAVALVGLVSLAIGAHAALNKRALDAAKAVGTEQTGSIGQGSSRVALVIGNGHYPDATAPLAQPINDARGLTAALRAQGVDVDVVEDATRDDMLRAIGRMKAKIKPDTVVMLFFGGYGVQVGRESYMIPVDATIWKESDIRRQGVSIESVLPPTPNASMWLDWMEAPADVPPTTAPRSCAATIASPTGVPQTIELSLSWLPPVMKMPVAWLSGSMKAGSSASSRFSGRTPTTLAAPSAANRAE